MTEAEFQAAILKEAKRFGWKAYHTYDSRRSHKGFPDLVLVRGVVCLFLELKAEDGVESDEQKEWIRALKQVNIVEADFAYPRHLDQIISNLSARAR